MVGLRPTIRVDKYRLISDITKFHAENETELYGRVCLDRLALDWVARKVLLEEVTLFLRSQRHQPYGYLGKEYLKKRKQHVQRS